MSFFSNNAGLLSFPTNAPTPMLPPGFDYESLTQAFPRRRSRADADSLRGRCRGSRVDGRGRRGGGFVDVPEGVGFDACLADFSLRCRERGLVDLLDPGVYVFRPPVAGLDMYQPVLSDSDRRWLTLRHPQLIDAFEQEVATAETPLSMVAHVARVKTLGMRVLIDDATLGPFETGAQITTLAIIDALAKHHRVAEVAVALGNHIPLYAAGRARPAENPTGTADGLNYSAFRDYDVLHRTAQPDQDFDVDAARVPRRDGWWCRSSI